MSKGTKREMARVWRALTHYQLKNGPDPAFRLPAAWRRQALRPGLITAATALVGLTFLLVFSSPCLAQSKATSVPETLERTSDATAQSAQQTYGTIRGRIVDQNGKAVAAAAIELTRSEGTLIQQAQSDENGAFAFNQVPPGAFRLVISEQGFVTQTISRTLGAGENSVVPQITLSLSTQVTQIRVSPPTEEIAQAQVREQEQQRIIGIVPNFYVTYLGQAAAPLNAKQKFRLALKATTDPINFAGVAVIAGVDQAADRFSGYGQGAEGYAKRYGASYANFNVGLLIGGAILPSILKQDPRYFYNGKGSKRSRFLYAISRTVVCKGDNQLWQPNYSSVLGDLAAGGISNLYLPEKNRGAALAFQNAAIALGATAVINVLQEFVLRSITSRRK
jgi:hypothetical protein